MRRPSNNILALACLAAVTASAQQVRLAYLYSDGNMPVTIQAYRALLAERPDLRNKVTLSFLTESVFDDVKVEDLTKANVLLLDTMNEQMLTRYNEAHKIDLVAAIKKQGMTLAIGSGLRPRKDYDDMGAVWDEKARAYWTHSGFANQLSLMKYALTKAGITGLTVPDVVPSLDFGYYYSDGKSGLVFATWEQFDAWRASHGKKRPGAPRVALGFYKSSYYTGDIEQLDAIIAEIERQGAEAIPLFGYPDGIAYQRLLTDPQGKSRADVALSLLFRFGDPAASIVPDTLDIPVINLVSLYGRTEKEWRESNQGLSMFEGTFQVAVPELAGLIAPTVVGSKEKITDRDTGLTMVVTHPIQSQIPKAVSRGLRYAALRSKANADKHLALIFYNYPPGKANIGASYLNVAESLSNLLTTLKSQGYNVGTLDLTPDGILKQITEKAVNVGGYAPGELAELVKQGNAIRIKAADYKTWLNALAPALKAKIIKDWGPPEKNKLMQVGGDLIIPAVQFGNIVLMPQPARGWGEDNQKLYHADNLAPHHQYVAAYSWLRNEFKADAVVHIGTHGTLEWLDGKDIGLNEEDAPDALISDLPDIYIYNVDVVGEGLVARRRGMATLVDHMVPPFKKGGLLPELAALSEAINDFDVNLHKNPELARATADRIRKQVTDLGIAKDMGLDLSKPESLDDALLHRIQDHMVELRSQNIPYGLHAFGRTPEKALRDTTIDAIVSTDRSLLPKNAAVLANEMEERIVASGPAELANITRALRGGFVPVSGGGEPIRNPDSYSTGRNFYGIDPDKVPKKASWEMGVKLAQQMLDDHFKKHGKYPEKISFVIWGDETMRHEGVIESQILYLLGAKPVWSDRDKVIDVQVIPTAQLGRPRVDIVIASAAEGMFNNITVLMDKAVQMVKAIEETDNFVRKHYLATKATLISKGYSEKDADMRAGVRIFDEPPGIFNLNTSTIAAASGTWETDKGMADDYIRKLGHGFGNGFWGESMEDVFRLALAGSEKVVHSSSTSLYGALDNDDMFMYMGGLATAIRNIDGKDPELLVTNTRDPGKPRMSTMDEFIGTEFRSRYVNPTWIEGMQKEGYAGAGAMREFVEYMWGWDATASSVIDDSMWKETFETYVEDKQKLGMKKFFEEKSPFAYQDITARMVETVRKGYWKADAATQKKLLEEFFTSVKDHGIGCSGNTCGNPRLLKYMTEQAKALGIPTPLIDGMQKAVEKATGKQISSAAKEVQDFVTLNEAAPTAISQQSAAAPPLEGYKMEVTRRDSSPQQTSSAVTGKGDWDVVFVSLPLMALLFFWRARNSRSGKVRQ
ncbi:MAG: cobaltochelatase subunit CobN [Acidobacteriota bacterium]